MNPIRIKNPDSVCRIVQLQPHQDIELTLTNDYKDYTTVNVTSHYLRVARVDEYENRRVFHIKQTKHSQGCNIFSTFYLGEITLGGGSLLAYMKAADPEKTNIVTMVNPGYDAIRLRPYQILEVVCYHPAFADKLDVWYWEWVPNILELDVEQMAYESSVPFFSMWDMGGPFITCPRTVEENLFTTQHHFWIRFDKTILNLVEGDKIGRAKYAGRLIFQGHPHEGSVDFIEGIVDVYLDGNRKHLQKCVQTLALPISPTSWEDRWCQKRAAGPVVKDVTITRIEKTSFDDGCRVIWDERQLCM